LQHSHKEDIYLNKILLSGLMIGFAAAFQRTDFSMGLKSYLAWSAILALLLSVFVHWVMRFWQDSQASDDAPELGYQVLDKGCDRGICQGDVVQTEEYR
jgi:hypothetical protein